MFCTRESVLTESISGTCVYSKSTSSQQSLQKDAIALVMTLTAGAWSALMYMHALIFGALDSKEHKSWEDRDGKSAKTSATA